MRNALLQKSQPLDSACLSWFLAGLLLALFCLTPGPARGQDAPSRPVPDGPPALSFPAPSPDPLPPDQPPGAEGRPVYTAAVLRDFPPLYQTDAEGRSSGFSLDVLGLVAARAGFETRILVADGWDQAMEAVRQGRADFIPGLAVTPGRSAEFAFTTPMEAVPLSVFVRVGSTGLSSPADLTGKRAAVLNDSAAQELIVRFGALPVLYPNLDSATFALLAGDVDACVMPKPVLLQKLDRIGLQGEARALQPPLLEVKRGYLLRTADTALLARLNTALAAVVASPEYAQAYARAYGSKRGFWTVRRVAWAGGAALAAVILLSFVLRTRTLTRMNAALRRIIDEREEAQAALREQEEEQRTILDSLSTGVMVVDPAARIVERINPAGAAMIGLPPEEIVNRPCTDFVCPGSSGLCPILDEGLAVDSSERSLLTADGRRLAILKTVLPVRMQGRDRLLESFVDITRLKAAEDDLRSSLAEKDVLLREVHHRVKNNMQIISSLLALQEGADPACAGSEPFLKSRQRIRAMAMVHEALYRSGALSALDSGAYLGDLARALAAAYDAAGRDVRLDLDLAPHLLEPDRAIPCGLLVNELLTNALRHAFDGRGHGVVRLSTRTRDGVFSLSVADDGGGMAPDASEPRGIGMQLSRSLVDQLGGSMRIDSGPHGTRVDVSFPA